MLIISFVLDAILILFKILKNSVVICFHVQNSIVIFLGTLVPLTNNSDVIMIEKTIDNEAKILLPDNLTSADSEKEVKNWFIISIVVSVVAVSYCNTACGVFKWGIQNWKGILIKINSIQMNYQILRIGVMASYQKLDII